MSFEDPLTNGFLGSSRSEMLMLCYDGPLLSAYELGLGYDGFLLNQVNNLGVMKVKDTTCMYYKIMESSWYRKDSLDSVSGFARFP